MTPHDMKVAAIIDELERQLRSQVLGKHKFYADILVEKKHQIEDAVTEAIKKMAGDGWKVKCAEKKKHFIIEVVGETSELHSEEA